MKTKIRKNNSGTFAVQTLSEKRDMVGVGIGDLRVLIVRDGKLWYAQGLDVDYGAQGTSVSDCKRNFEIGLADTIKFHLELNGHIDDLLVPAPPEVFTEAAKKSKSIKRFRQFTIHALIAKSVLPYEAIQYLDEAA